MQSCSHAVMRIFDAVHRRELFSPEPVYRMYKLAKIPNTVLLNLFTNDLSCKLNSCVQKAALAEY